jgi:hypothetical protein
VAPVRARASRLADLGSSAASVCKGKKMADRFAEKYMRGKTTCRNKEKHVELLDSLERTRRFKRY